MQHDNYAYVIFFAKKTLLGKLTPLSE